MTHIFIAFLIAMLLPADGIRHCGRTATDDEQPQGANEIISYRWGHIRRLQGVVEFADGNRVEHAVVEVYALEKGDDDNDLNGLYYRGTRLRAVVTGPDGTFCFPELRSGRYFIVAGTVESKGFNRVYASLTISQRAAEEGDLHVQLEVGT